MAQVDGEYEDWLEVLRLMYHSGAKMTLMHVNSALILLNSEGEIVHIIKKTF